MNRRTAIIAAALILVLSLGGFLAAGSSSDSSQAASKGPRITFVPPGPVDATNPPTTNGHQVSTGTTHSSTGTSTHDNGSTKTNTVSVPNVVGAHELDARDKIQNAGLRVVVVRHYVTRSSDDDKVTAETPNAGATVASGSPVIIDVATYDIHHLTIVPNLSGMDDTTAKTTLTNVGLAAAISYVQVAYPPKVGVTAQNPAPYAPVVVGTTVHIVVTTKQPVLIGHLPQLVQPPTQGPVVVNLRGLTCAQASAIVTSEGYVPNCFYVRDWNPAHFGVVFYNQTGATQPLGSTVELDIGAP